VNTLDLRDSQIRIARFEDQREGLVAKKLQAQDLLVERAGALGSAVARKMIGLLSFIT